MSQFRVMFISMLITKGQCQQQWCLARPLSKSLLIKQKNVRNLHDLFISASTTKQTKTSSNYICFTSRYSKFDAPPCMNLSKNSDKPICETLWFLFKPLKRLRDDLKNDVLNISYSFSPTDPCGSSRQRTSHRYLDRGKAIWRANGHNHANVTCKKTKSTNGRKTHTQHSMKKCTLQKKGLLKKKRKIKPVVGFEPASTSDDPWKHYAHKFVRDTWPGLLGNKLMSFGVTETKHWGAGEWTV